MGVLPCGAFRPRDGVGRDARPLPVLLSTPRRTRLKIRKRRRRKRKRTQTGQCAAGPGVRTLLRMQTDVRPLIGELGRNVSFPVCDKSVLRKLTSKFCKGKYITSDNVMTSLASRPRTVKIARGCIILM